MQLDKERCFAARVITCDATNQDIQSEIETMNASQDQHFTAPFCLHETQMGLMVKQQISIIGNTDSADPAGPCFFIALEKDSGTPLIVCCELDVDLDLSKCRRITSSGLRLRTFSRRWLS